MNPPRAVLCFLVGLGEGLVEARCQCVVPVPGLRTAAASSGAGTEGTYLGICAHWDSHVRRGESAGVQVGWLLGV